MTARQGERRTQILQVLAELLQQPDGERITTARLAATIGISEAALYRHFASKGQMYESLVEFIEQALIRLMEKIQQDPAPVPRKVESLLTVLLAFAQKNPGMTRVLVGEALIGEPARLLARMGELHRRISRILSQCLAEGGVEEHDAIAGLMFAFVLGRWQQFVQSGFGRAPLEDFPVQLRWLLAGLEGY